MPGFEFNEMQKKSNGERNIVGFTCGAFDFLHPGHLFFLDEASKKCDVLIIGLHTDPSIERPKKNKPTQTSLERYLQLSILPFEKRIIPYDTENDLINIFSTFKIDFRYIGCDYKNKSFTGKSICIRLGIKISYINRFHSWSSSSFKERLVHNDNN